MAKVVDKRGHPDRLRRELCDEHMHHAVASQAHTPDQIILGRSVVSDHFCPTCFEDFLGMLHDIVFQAASADGADAPAVGDHEQPGARAAVGGALDLHQSGENRATGRGGLQCVQNLL